MACLDRSNDFQSIVTSLSKGTGIDSTERRTFRSNLTNGNASSASNLQKNKNLNQMKVFNSSVSALSQKLASTFEKVEKLSALARKQSLFEDRGPEIQELTFIIKQDIGDFSARLLELQEYQKQNTASPLAAGTNNLQAQSHSQNVLRVLKSHADVLRNKFETLLRSHWQSLKRQEERRGQFVGTVIRVNVGAADAASSISQSPSDQSLAVPLKPSRLLHDDLQARSNDCSEAVHIDMTSMHQQLQLSLADQSLDYLQSRAQAISSVESTMQELGRIFAQLATLVQEQGESVARIDANTEDVEMNVQRAHSELLKYFQSISSNRWLVAKVGAIVVIFFILFIFLFA